MTPKYQKQDECYDQKGNLETQKLAGSCCRRSNFAEREREFKFGAKFSWAPNLKCSAILAWLKFGVGVPGKLKYLSLENRII